MILINGELPRSPENCITSSVIGPKMTMWPCGGKSQAPGHLSVWLGSTWSVWILRVSQDDQWKIWSGIVNHKSLPQNKCLTHSWPQQVDTYKNSFTNILLLIFSQHSILNWWDGLGLGWGLGGCWWLGILAHYHPTNIIWNVAKNSGLR